MFLARHLLRVPFTGYCSFAETGGTEPPLTVWPGLEYEKAVRSDAESLVVLNSVPSQRANATGFLLPPPEGSRLQLTLAEGWRFRPVDSTKHALGEIISVQLPFTFPMQREYHAGWLFNRVCLEKRANERIAVLLPHVAMFSAVYVNGRECGRHIGSFTPFEFDITEAVISGANVIALYVHDESAAVIGDAAYATLGLTRRHDFDPRGGMQVAPIVEVRTSCFIQDVFIKTSTRTQTLELSVELSNLTGAPLHGSVRFQVLEWPHGDAADLTIPDQQVDLAKITNTLTLRLPWKNPRLWSPEHPNLYVLQATLRTDQGIDETLTRFGFREFWVEGKQMMLNGAAIRLRGESMFRSSRNRDQNRESFLTYKRLLGVNAFRPSASICPRETIEAADEAGILLMPQSSAWTQMGRFYLAGGDLFLKNVEREFEEWVRRDRNSPSLVIWDVENELLRDDPARANRPMVMRFDEFVRKFDDTRPINHSSAGWYDAGQELIHLHMQENYTKIMDEWIKRGERPLIMGEFWIGGRGEERRISSRELASRLDSFEEDARLYEIAMLEMRYYGISGIMPLYTWKSLFAALPDPYRTEYGRVGYPPFMSWPTGKSWYSPGMFETGYPPNCIPRSDAAVQAVRHGLQPMTIFFWPRDEAAEEGATVERELVICNDSETTQTFTAVWGVEGRRERRETIVLQPAEQRRIPVSERAPAGGGTLHAQLILNSDRLVSEDRLLIREIPSSVLTTPQLSRKVLVYEKAGEESALTRQRLNELGIEVQLNSDPTPPGDPSSWIWLIAAHATGVDLDKNRGAIRHYLESGGRILCLAQEKWPRWSPITLNFWPAILAVPPEFAEFGWPEDSKDLLYSRYAPIYAKEHPIFAGIHGDDLRWWSAFDGRISDDAIVRPASVDSHAQGAWRVLAGACRYENASIVEARIGKGALVFCQAQLLENRNHPEARAVLFNALRYLDGKTWADLSNGVQLGGDLSPASIAEQTGVPVDALQANSEERPKIIFAGDKADIDQLRSQVIQGATIVVLSAETASRLPGFKVAKESESLYSAARGNDHPIFWGIASTNFPEASSCIEGEFIEFPQEAVVLLKGLRNSAQRHGSTIGRKVVIPPDACAPVAVLLKEGRGEWIVTTLTPQRRRTAHDAELMSTLLGNAGVEIPPPQNKRQRVRVKKAGPITLDGNLREWTDDMEDRNVSQFVHAEPIYFHSQDAQGADLQSDAQFSGIAYFLWDAEHLYLAGATFGPVEQTNLTINLNGHDYTITGFPNNVRGPRDTAGMETDASTLLDTRALTFTQFSPVQGVWKPVTPRAATFESRIPWPELGFQEPPKELPARMQLRHKDGFFISVPGSTDETAGLMLVLER